MYCQLLSDELKSIHRNFVCGLADLWSLALAFSSSTSSHQFIPSPLLFPLDRFPQHQMNEVISEDTVIPVINVIMTSWTNKLEDTCDQNCANNVANKRESGLHDDPAMNS